MISAHRSFTCISNTPLGVIGHFLSKDPVSGAWLFHEHVTLWRGNHNPKLNSSGKLDFGWLVGALYYRMWNVEILILFQVDRNASCLPHAETSSQHSWPASTHRTKPELLAFRHGIGLGGLLGKPTTPFCRIFMFSSKQTARGCN